MTPLFLAHQSGWDELLLFAGPIVVMLVWVRWAEKRAKQRKTEALEASSNMPSDTDV